MNQRRDSRAIIEKTNYGFVNRIPSLVVDSFISRIINSLKLNGIIQKKTRAGGRVYRYKLSIERFRIAIKKFKFLPDPSKESEGKEK